LFALLVTAQGAYYLKTHSSLYMAVCHTWLSPPCRRPPIAGNTT